MAENQQMPRDAYRDELTHVDEKGDVRMVDVSDKAVTKREAVAEGTILMHPETQAMVLEDRAKKGDVLACARVAGIMAAKRTSDLIPMCHPLPLTKAKVEIEPVEAGERADGRVGFHVVTTTGVTGVTGIEMEALTAASVACLTIYDMCKAVDRGMEIVDVRLLRKEGGRSGLWERAYFFHRPFAPNHSDFRGLDFPGRQSWSNLSPGVIPKERTRFYGRERTCRRQRNARRRHQQACSE